MTYATVLMILAGCVLLLLAWRGWRRGLVARVIELLGLVVSFLLATRLAPGWSPQVAATLHLGPRWAAFGTWVVLFLAGLLATWLIAWAVSRIIHVSVVGWADRLGGALLGLAIGVLVASLLLVAVTSLPGSDEAARELRRHTVSRLVYTAAPALYMACRDLGGEDDPVWRRVGEQAREQIRAAGRVAAGRLEPEREPEPEPVAERDR